jgi:hypothetical protein
MAIGASCKKMLLLPWLIVACSTFISSGCGSGFEENQKVPGRQIQGLQLYPATVNLVQGNGVRFELNTNAGQIPASQCTWTAGTSAILASKGNGEFVGTGVGSSSVTATCNGMSASSSVLVSPISNPMAITITSGGTYSGTWSSIDPEVPAVTIRTNERVALQNSSLTSRGDLIIIYGRDSGANVTIDNVTGTALDPGVAGRAKGKFVGSEDMASLSVTHCTMHNVSFGVYVSASTHLELLTIKDNVADNIDDRKSDGKGGYLLNQRVLGHFIQLGGVSALNGGELSWNQLINFDGEASIEDLLSFYGSRGTANKNIKIHDNYLEGAIATGQTTPYTGTGIQTDGDFDDPSIATGFLQVFNNTVVHLAGSGISIGAGHDISMTGNRIVSCGKDTAGNWITQQGSTALSMLNYYHTNQYFNNSMTNNSGGLVTPDESGKPIPGDSWVPSTSESFHNVVSSNVFEQPCLANSDINLNAELAERARWVKAAAQAGERLGDQH